MDGEAAGEATTVIELISLGRGIKERPVGITEAAEKASGDGQDAENGGLHREIVMLFD